MTEPRARDYVIRVDDAPAAIDAAAWDGLLALQAAPTIFMRHAYLAALHASGSATPRTGWQAQILTLWRGADLQAAAPAYLKQHSFGEYVFDWAWADAYQRRGLRYYPKLLVAVPFTPVPGSRLMARDEASRAALADALLALARRHQVSSAHVLFHDEAERAAMPPPRWLARQTVQFHWQHAASGGPASFEQLLAGLQRDKRKKIQQERRRVAAAGVILRVLEGGAIDDAAWHFFHRCYVQTYRAHQSTPYLSRDFFRRMAATMTEHWVLFLAERNGVRIAASLIAVDPAQRVAYGRYWGAIEHVDCLHFEACYYRPLQWCLDHGYLRFEGGAQGEHKMARGLLPVRTFSSHWLDHPAFADAVDRYLQAEGRGIDAYVDELNERDPFKRA